MSRIFITGIGIISPLGNNLAENELALRNGVHGLSRLELFNTRYAGLLPAGEIKTNDQALKELLHCHDKSATRTMLLALHAFRDAIEDSGLATEELSSPHTALIGATTVGGMCLTDELYKDANLQSSQSSYLSSYDMASVTLFLQKRYQVGGIINTINTACSSSANAIAYGARLLKAGLAKRAIVGGADSLAKYTINGFNSLMILSPELCKPFDEQRNGLNLGEGAAFMVLEKEEDIKNKNVYAELKGYGNANDAFHPSSLSASGTGPLLAMNAALQSGSLLPEDISYINAHGTGTENNDEVESAAMIKLFGKNIPFSSTKSNTGHTLGAAGAIEAVFCTLNLQHQQIYPGLRFTKPIPGTALEPVTTLVKKNMQHVMSNSFGFGGNCSSLIFSKVN